MAKYFVECRNTTLADPDETAGDYIRDLHPTGACTGIQTAGMVQWLGFVQTPVADIERDPRKVSSLTNGIDRACCILDKELSPREYAKEGPMRLLIWNSLTWSTQSIPDIR